jgi:hypothetical protein
MVILGLVASTDWSVLGLVFLGMVASRIGRFRIGPSTVGKYYPTRCIRIRAKNVIYLTGDEPVWREILEGWTNCGPGLQSPLPDSTCNIGAT